MGKFIRVLFAVALAVMSVLGVAGTATAAPPAPQGSISGHVYKDDGTTPIGGATIYADYEAGGVADTAISSADGTYTILSLAAGKYKVHAIATNYQTEYYNNVKTEGAATLITVTSPGNTSGINFTLTPAGSISGHIYKEDGTTPISGAEVVADFYGTNAWANSAFSAADGSYTINQLVSGDYHVHAVKTGFVTMWYDDIKDESSATKITVAAPADVPNININLPLAGSISGYVYEANGTTPIAGAEVVVDYYDTNTHANSSWTSDNGSYTVGGLITGDYHVHALKSTYATMWYDNVSLESLATSIAVTAPSTTSNINISLPKAGTISGYIFELDGTPIVGAWVIADRFVENTYVNSTWTGADGSFSIGALVTENYSIHAIMDNHRTMWWKSGTNGTPMEYARSPIEVYAPGDTPDMNLRLPPTGSISGHVYEQDGKTPVVGATVVASYWRTDPFRGSAISGADGSYTIYGLISEQYSLYASATGFNLEYYKNQTALKYSDPVTVSAPGNTAGVDFSLDSLAPRTDTMAASDLTSTSARLNGDLTWAGPRPAEGLPATLPVTVSFDWGTTEGGPWPYNSGVVATMYLEGGFSYDLTGRTPGVTYYYRAKAQNSNGIDYGVEKSFTTPPQQPAVTTDNAESIGSTSATLKGNLTSLGTPADNVTVSFEWGTTKGGPYPSYNAGQTMTNTGTFSYSLPTNSLTPATTYYYRAKADGPGDPVYGAELSFTTLPGATTTPPSVTTVDASSIAATSATLNGNVTALGTAASVTVSFGYATTAGGPYTSVDAGSLTAAGTFSANLSGLTAATKYYFIAKAAGDGAVDGAEKSFTTTTDIPPADTTPPTITLLNASAITKAGSTITWTTNEGATSQVQYGLTAEYTDTTDEITTPSTSHSVELTGLQAGKTYHYRVISKDAAGNQKVSEDGTFTTDKSSGGGMPVWAWVLIGLAGVAVVGGGGFFAFSKMAKK